MACNGLDIAVTYPNLASDKPLEVVAGKANPRDLAVVIPPKQHVPVVIPARLPMPAATPPKAAKPPLPPTPPPLHLQLHLQPSVAKAAPPVPPWRRKEQRGGMIVAAPAPAPKLRGSAAAMVARQEAVAKEATIAVEEALAKVAGKLQKRSKGATVAVKQEEEAAAGKQEEEAAAGKQEAGKRRRVEVKQEPDAAASHWSETLEQLRREQAEEAGEAASSSVALPVLHRGKSLY